MSSFKRKPSGKQALHVLPGTRISPASNLSLITSTGISSLDDILGGGVPLTCSILYAAPDIHSSYGDLIQKYFVAQGIFSGHRVCIIGEDAKSFAHDAMWLPKSQGAKSGGGGKDSDDEDSKSTDASQKVKIAWRYEKMKQFQTTVGNTSPDAESFCPAFELSSTVPEEVIKEATENDRLHYVDVGEKNVSTTSILEEVSRYLEGSSTVATRICITRLGTAGWGDLTAQSVLYFLHSLRSILRRHGHGCASISLGAEISTDGWGGSGWIEKLGWATDGAVTVSAFTGNPGLRSIFPSHHGLVSLHRLPSAYTLSPPSDRFSTLRGLGSSGENNLAFKCTRKRLVFETLHLDVEGGTGERRTTPAATTTTTTTTTIEVEKKKVKSKKKVVFSSDPYDF